MPRVPEFLPDSVEPCVWPRAVHRTQGTLAVRTQLGPPHSQDRRACQETGTVPACVTHNRCFLRAPSAIMHDAQCTMAFCGHMAFVVARMTAIFCSPLESGP